jgi:hypothetical protein
MKLLTLRDRVEAACPPCHLGLADPLWDQFAALLPPRPTYVATHSWGCHRRRIGDRIVFDKLMQSSGTRCGCA